MNEEDKVADKIIMSVNRLSLPATILIASIILGGFYYMTQTNKQESIERQQSAQMLAETNQNQKEFIAKQKEACLNIYKVENGKYNNVSGWRYDEQGDECYIQYKASPRKTALECDVQYKDTKGDVYPAFFMEWLLCKDGLFENRF